MIVGIPQEIEKLEKRVAATPETVKKMTAKGLQVVVQAGAGQGAAVRDADYEAAGAQVVPDAKSIYERAEIILKVRKPLDEEIGLLREGQILIALLQALIDPEHLQKLAQRKITAFSMDTIPRISRAQKLDALSSQSNVAGYKSVLMAGDYSGKMMPMMMTAAGTISPAKVLVLGAGVAGLQAIATAKRLGAVVEAFDVRPAVKEQVESLGAKFISLETQEAEDQGGYAKELSDEQHHRELEMIARHAAAADMVITTALIPGKPAPVLITAAMVSQMKEGSVIVDLAAEGGGNCELTKAGENILHQGVMIMGPLNIPSLMAAESSQLYSRNVLNFLFEFYQKGEINIQTEDEIIKGALVVHQGQVTLKR
ncbi:MAG: Re/Si-specific NAD(P)(+) transhydrogenase subunit alpha [Candidatus Omnitrophica bacterium]|nr:Re/Si-specific NAD(P)(+) transhydrogenase subunit alpha [Candidatus Omnitrophota bacterium]